MQCGRFSDRGVHDPLLHKTLHLPQQCLPLGAIALYRLLPEQRIEFEIAAIGVDPCDDPIGLDARGGVAISATGP
jgi:hypothetical protein